ncbi:MAG: cupin domain-containing protein [Deltaproteobacteria bacterium]|nr:MAG: cupin domain-containing protein [Deltaproteobacteria bacterium]TMQ10843.1 MAG: cupin domain-containing protein [Deltaproteobacteria bacterium]
MTGDLRELLPLYALGILETDEASVVERAIASDAALAAELAAYQRTTETLGSVVQPVAPSPAVKQRLMASVGGGRFEVFAARMARMFDVTLDRARELLGLIERPASWIPQVVPGISFVDFEGGPAAAAADCGFVRLAPGAVFPPHTHIGEEMTTILAGRVHDPVNDRTIGPGEDYLRAAGTSHHLVCIGDEDCIYASRAMDGIAIAGTRVRPTREPPPGTPRDGN